MSKHVSYRGVTIDMDSIRRENEKVPAIGNMKVNAKGDQIKGGKVTKTAEQIARENHRVQTTVIKSGLKGKPPSASGITLEPPKSQKPETPKPAKKTKEVELPSGDIVIENDES